MTNPGTAQQRVFYVVEMTVAFSSLEQVRQQAPQELAEHLRLSTELHQQGEVLMAGAFLQPQPGDEHLQTMAICVSQDAAQRFVAGDPFVRAGRVISHRIRPWANMFAR